jgi:hypothetical protein
MVSSKSNFNMVISEGRDIQWEKLMCSAAWQSQSVMNRAPGQGSALLCDSPLEVSQNTTSFDYFSVETSLVAFVIAWGRYQDHA